MASCEHLERTSRYFDGELPPGEEREAADHLATCAACQALLGDAVALDAALSQAPARAVHVAPRRRWPVVAVGVVAAAALAIVVLRPKPPAPTDHVALVLPPARSLEARFSGDAFVAYRPYEAPRERAHEAIDVRAFDELERTGKTGDLVGALASSGELVRAAEVARRSSGDAKALADLAAIALAGGDAETALDLAYRAQTIDPSLTVARWNLGLAARQLRYWRVSRAAFEQVAARGEPGWAAEARQDVALLDRELHRGDAIARLRAQFELLVRAGSVRNTILDPALQDDLEELQRRTRAVKEDQTPIELVEVRLFPSHALQFLHESLRAPTPDLVEGLEPVAAALDRESGTTVASSLVQRALAERGRLTDPFAALASDGDTVPDACKNVLYAVPCAALVQDLARRQLQAGRFDEALANAERGRDLALRAHTPVDYALLSDVHRHAQRNALARADIEEAALAAH